MRIHADPEPDSGQTLNSHKVEFYMKNLLKVFNWSTNIPAKVQKPVRKEGKRVSLLILINFRALDLDLDPDPDPYPHSTKNKSLVYPPPRQRRELRQRRCSQGGPAGTS
jgi:hypothetical protein